MADSKSDTDTKEEITSITITPAENGCTVNVRTRKPAKRKNSYDSYDYNDRTYIGEAALMETVMSSVASEVADGKDDDKPKVTFDSKSFK